MADNLTLNTGSGGAALACKEVSHSGDTAQLQAVHLVGISGSEGSYTIADIGGDAANGLDVDVTRVSGNVTVVNAGTFAVQAAQSGAWTVTANLSATDNAVLDAIQAAVEIIDNCISGSEAQVDVVAALPAGTNLLGKVSAGLDGTNFYDGTTALTLKRASGIATSSGANTLIGAVADKKIRILALSLVATSATAVSLYLYNGDNNFFGDGTNKITLDLNGADGPPGIVLPFNPGGWFQTDTANELVGMNLSAATPVIWVLTYVEVS